jgi:hypothetical protein
MLIIIFEVAASGFEGGIFDENIQRFATKE